MVPQPARLEIRLLGPMQVQADDDTLALLTVPLTSDKARALLAYLAVYPDQSHRREKLAGLLWPDSSESAARASLRTALARVRDTTGDREMAQPLLEITRQTITLWPSDICRIDLADFEAHLHHSIDDGQDIAELNSAVTLYRGSFLEGFTLAGCAEFEEWLTIQREHCRRLAMEAMERLATALWSRGDLAQAIELVQRQVEIEPWLEEGHRRLMALLASNGRRSEALAQFKRCRQIMVTELGVEPDTETMALHQRIRDEAGLPQPQSAKIVPLPMPLTPLIGREQEMDDLVALLANPTVRLVTILGPGGIGKTHLALVLAQRRQERYPDGVAFVPFAPVHDSDRFAVTVGQALGLPFYGEGSPREQLFHHLQDKRLLLVLDNLEHLLPVRDEIVALLRASPHLTVLCTSRRRLGVQGEHCYALDGLAMSAADSSDDAALKKTAALDLFVQSGRRSDPIFSLTAENSAAVAAVCQAVDGLPLGIILAASWLDMLSPAELADRITLENVSPDNQWFDLLESDEDEIPSRHRSLRAVVESVWSMLSAHEQAVFATLSIFRGGFNAEAALAVAAASLSDLRGLAAKSCLQVSTVSDVGRYQIHEYLRQYGFEQLQHMADAEVSARCRHADFYMTMLRHAGPAMKDHRQVKTIESLSAEIENIRAAWRWAVKQGKIDMLNNAVESLGQYYEWRGLPQDGADDCRRVIASVSETESIEAYRLLARVHAWCAVFERLLGKVDEADQHQRMVLDMLDTLANSGEGTDAEWGHLLINIGTGAQYHDELRKAEAAFRQGYEAFLAVDDNWGVAQARQRIAWTLFNRGQFRAGIEETNHALNMRRTLGDTRGIAESLMSLTLCLWALGRLAEGLDTAREAMTHWQMCGDRRGAAATLGDLAKIHLLLGQTERSSSYAWEAVSELQALGMEMWMALEQCVNTSEVCLYSGQYTETQNLLVDGLAVAHRQNGAWPIGAGLIRQAKLSLAGKRAVEAAARLAEAILLLTSIERLDELGDAHITLATSVLLQGETEQAREHLAKGLQIAVKTEHYAMLCHGMAASALLAAVEGNTALAVERYAIAMAEPFVANSRWFADVYEGAIQGAERSVAESAGVDINGDTCERNIRSCCEDVLIELMMESSVTGT